MPALIRARIGGRLAQLIISQIRDIVWLIWVKRNLWALADAPRLATVAITVTLAGSPKYIIVASFTAFL
jgi:hypothetical protein